MKTPDKNYSTYPCVPNQSKSTCMKHTAVKVNTQDGPVGETGPTENAQFSFIEKSMIVKDGWWICG